MPNKKIIILVLVLAVVTVVSGCLKKGIKTVVEENNKQQKIEEEVKKQKVEEIATTIDDIDTNNWKVYRNEEYGYVLNYPNNWKVNETKYYEEDFGIWVKYVSFSDGNEYYLIFLLNKINENFNMGRTGIGAGDFENIRIWNIGGIDIKVNDLVYENKIREIFFSGRNDLYNLSGHFSYSGNAYDNNFNFDKTKFKIAENIIKSFKFIENNQNTKIYTNNQQNYSLWIPKNYTIQDIINKCVGDNSKNCPWYNRADYLLSDIEFNDINLKGNVAFGLKVFNTIDESKIKASGGWESIKNIGEKKIGEYNVKIFAIDKGVPEMRVIFDNDKSYVFLHYLTDEKFDRIISTFRLTK